MIDLMHDKQVGEAPAPPYMQMTLPRGVAVGPGGAAKVAAARASEGPGQYALAVTLLR